MPAVSSRTYTHAQTHAELDDGLPMQLRCSGHSSVLGSLWEQHNYIDRQHHTLRSDRLAEEAEAAAAAAATPRRLRKWSRARNYALRKLARHTTAERMVVRKLAPSDDVQHEVPALLASAFANYNQADFRARLRRPNVVCFAGLVAGQLGCCAVLTMEPAQGVVILDFLAVAAALVGRRRGFGRRLIRLLSQELQAELQDKPDAVLFTDADSSAVGFYKKCGFVPVGAAGAARGGGGRGGQVCGVARPSFGQVRQERGRLAAMLDPTPQPPGSVEMGLVLHSCS